MNNRFTLLNFEYVDHLFKINHRKKLIENIEKQIFLATDSTHSCAPITTITGDDGVERSLQVAKGNKCWWREHRDGTIILCIKYGGRPLELVKGVSTIRCANAADVADALGQIKSAVAKGELDTLLEAHVRVGKFRSAASVTRFLRE